MFPVNSKMLFLRVVLLGYCCVLGVVRSEMTADDEELLTTDIELDEFDFEEICAQNIPYDWSRIVQKNYNSKEAVTTAEAYAQAQRQIAEKFSARLRDNSPTRKPETTRKLELLARPGDVLLPTAKYKQLLLFSDAVQEAIAKKRKACSLSTTSCDLTSDSPEQLLETWTRQSVVGADAVSKDYPIILDLVTEAALKNGFTDAEAYWLALSDLDSDAYNRAKILWEEVKPLYQKLHSLVAKKLQKKYGKTVLPDTSKSIPVHLLGSYLGNDWSNIANVVLSSSCGNTFHNIEKTMEEEGIKGKGLYQKAQTLTGYLHFGKLSKRFWEESEFDHACPAKIINPCRSGVRVAACNTASWSNYLDAHRIVVEGAYTDDANAISSLSFILKSGNRYSAIRDAVAGLAEILASSRHYMAQYGLVTPTDKCALQTVLTLSAMRLLPSMAYYLVADLARLQAITTNNTKNIGGIWQKLQYDIQGISTSGQEWWGFLSDPHITSNEPQINKFYGILLQFHLFEELMTNNEESFADAEEFIHKKKEFKTLLVSGISKKWPELLEGIFNIKGITPAPLLQFFNQLELTLSSVPSNVSTSNTKSNVESSTTQKITNALVIDGDGNNHTVFSNEIETESVMGTNVEEGYGLSSYLLISFFVLVGVIILIVIVKIVWKKTRKHYEPPSNQNELA